MGFSVKDLLIILLLALPGLAHLDVPVRMGCDADPSRVSKLVPGTSSYLDVVRELGCEPCTDTMSCYAPFTACWYSGGGPGAEPELLVLDWRIDAEFDSNDTLIRVRLQGEKRDRSPLNSIVAVADLADLRVRRDDQSPSA